MAAFDAGVAWRTVRNVETKKTHLPLIAPNCADGHAKIEDQHTPQGISTIFRHGRLKSWHETWCQHRQTAKLACSMNMYNPKLTINTFARHGPTGNGMALDGVGPVGVAANGSQVDPGAKATVGGAWHAVCVVLRAAVPAQRHIWGKGAIGINVYRGLVDRQVRGRENMDAEN